MQNHKSAWYFAFLVLGYILYLIFGAIVFSSVELPYEDLLRQELRAVKKTFLQENECLSEERLERFLKKALEASNYGVSILNNASVNWNWDFTSALFFASTVLSTTGECWSVWMMQPTRCAAQDYAYSVISTSFCCQVASCLSLCSKTTTTKKSHLSDFMVLWLTSSEPLLGHRNLWPAECKQTGDGN